jgi:NNP family nitrate/nitrite transporter-like MFS transporter
MSQRLNLLNLRDPKIVTLHLSWFAFFVTFMIWFNHAPLLAAIQSSLGLTESQLKGLLVVNVALTIPARIGIGMLVDKFGPRRTFSALLIAAAFGCFLVASAQSFAQLALFRLLLGFVGAGFVIGIRLVGEWFPAKQVGVAEGVYGGWGNFGAAASAIVLPSLAALYGGAEGWRFAMVVTGVLGLVYGFVFYWKVRDTPKGSTYFKPKKNGGLEVTSKRDFYMLLLMNLPMYGALLLTIWKLGPSQLGLISSEVVWLVRAALFALFVLQTSQLVRVNRSIFQHAVPELQRYRFRQVAILDIAYMVSFGSELAVVSMLPLFFLKTFPVLGQVQAALLASGFALMNLVARPAGGWFSDKLGRRRTLTALTAGLMLGYVVLSRIDGSWSIPFTVLCMMSCSFFVQAACGAVFAMVPLVRRRMTGQIAGMVGAFGNVGGVVFLTVLSLVDYSTFFLTIAGAAALSLLTCLFLDEPKGHVAEVHDDGRVEFLKVA